MLFNLHLSLDFLLFCPHDVSFLSFLNFWIYYYFYNFIFPPDFEIISSIFNYLVVTLEITVGTPKLSKWVLTHWLHSCQKIWGVYHTWSPYTHSWLNVIFFIRFILFFRFKTLLTSENIQFSFRFADIFTAFFVLYSFFVLRPSI